MDEKKQNEFAMFSEIWNLHQLCQEQTKQPADNRVNVAAKAKEISKNHKSEFCKDLISSVLSEYQRNLKLI